MSNFWKIGLYVVVLISLASIVLRERKLKWATEGWAECASGLQRKGVYTYPSAKPTGSDFDWSKKNSNAIISVKPTRMCFYPQHGQSAPFTDTVAGADCFDTKSGHLVAEGKPLHLSDDLESCVIALNACQKWQP